MGIPEQIIPVKNIVRSNIDPKLNDREMQVINILAQCRAAFIDSINIWPNKLKGIKRIQSLIRWGILWSYSLGEKEIVTLSPVSERIAGTKAYIPGDPREVLKIVTASELFIRALSKVPCTFERAQYPLQGVLKVGDYAAGVIVLLKGDKILSQPDINCLVICEDKDHITKTADSISFPALFTTYDILIEKDISEAFHIYEDKLYPVRLNIFQ
jgi:hypothetical protein